MVVRRPYYGRRYYWWRWATRRSSEVTIFDRLRVGEGLRWTHSPAKESRVMPTIETTATIIVKPRPPDEWIVVTPRLHSEIYFHGRQRALQFARA